MADNRQTIAQIPYNLEDPTSFNRFLSTLVENLDTVLGFRGDTKYVTDKDLQSQGSSLSDLSGQLRTLSAKSKQLTEDVSDLTSQLKDATDLLDEVKNATSTAQLSESFHNFNDASWSSLQGTGEFKTKGGSITNSPQGFGANEDVIVLASSVKTSDSVWQTIYIDVNDGAGKSVWSRFGVNSNWIKLG